LRNENIAQCRATYIHRSLMTEGQLDALNDEQARDLLGYLMTPKFGSILAEKWRKKTKK
jgi:hypothetical protein